MKTSYEIIEARPVLRFERRIGHPVEAVWRAITEPEQLRQWFPSDVEADLSIGGQMTFRFPKQSLGEEPMTLPGEVTELDPPRRFSFLWGEDHLHFMLEPAEGGAACHLLFTVELDNAEKAARDGAGWHVCLDALKRVASGEQVARPDENPQWREYYEEYRRRGFPATAPIPGEG